MDSKNEKGWVSHPPTAEQTERIKAACATTQAKSVDAENLLKSLGYSFRTVNAAGNGYQTVAQVKSKRRDWRPVAAAWDAIKQQLRLHGIRVSDPATMFKFETVIERLCWANRVDTEDLNAGRYPYYWEEPDREKVAA